MFNLAVSLSDVSVMFVTKLSSDKSLFGMVLNG